MHRIEITGVGSELQGVGRLPDGRAVFVPGAIPGELVEIEITRDKGRFCEASLVAVLSPSPDRIQPACPHYGTCGGCQARHMSYTRTLAFKRQVVYDALTRIGGLKDPDVSMTLGCDPSDRTRNKAEYPIGMSNGRPVVGVYARGGREIIPLNDCLLQSPESIRALNRVSEWLKSFPMASHLKYLVTRTSHTGELMVILSGDAPMQSELMRYPIDIPNLHSLWYCHLSRRPTHALDGRCERLFGNPSFKDRLFDLDFELSPQSFFQVNRHQAERLYQTALDAIGIRPGCDLTLLDAYCGAGTITLSAARYAKSAIGIEIVPPAIENARHNAQLNQITNTRFICADAAREIPKILSQGTRFDSAILDPPRKGADPNLLNALIQSKIPKICYVSCNPATLARDLRPLTQNHYHLQSAHPIDMFPWTGPVETVVLMSRVKD